MNLQNLIILVLLAAFFIEGSIISFPIIFLLSIILFMLFPNNKTFITIFLISIIADSLYLRPLGISSLILFAIFLFFNLYKNIFEMKNYLLIAFSSTFFTFMYAYFFSYSTNIILHLIFFIIGLTIFYILSNKKLLW
ncbi:MAG: hypothetical protein COU27_01550 [Candidatus Levybacteria bacterium CG10_big_fil_rev_8_21_14_0_10_36_7]|nr:MAG: hypothetical protein COU27_01550 [Candidatus Levybacteria bacterium CG10_big_fil_rev_8_21_14_0_10_36_7]